MRGAGGSLGLLSVMMKSLQSVGVVFGLGQELSQGSDVSAEIGIRLGGQFAWSSEDGIVREAVQDAQRGNVQHDQVDRPNFHDGESVTDLLRLLFGNG